MNSEPEFLNLEDILSDSRCIGFGISHNLLEAYHC